MLILTATPHHHQLCSPKCRAASRTSPAFLLILFNITHNPPERFKLLSVFRAFKMKSHPQSFCNELSPFPQRPPRAQAARWQRRAAPAAGGAGPEAGGGGEWAGPPLPPRHGGDGTGHTWNKLLFPIPIRSCSL